MAEKKEIKWKERLMEEGEKSYKGEKDIKERGTYGRGREI
jgi:hypothetical protein